MKMNVHLNFQGNCGEAFAFYKKVFGAQEAFTMKYSEAPAGMPVAPDWGDKVMHTSIAVGGGQLMGCDAPAGRATPLGGFQISIETADQTDAERIFGELKEGGSVQMAMSPTFWSPLFGMCTDRYGVGWMVGVPGPAA